MMDFLIASHRADGGSTMKLSNHVAGFTLVALSLLATPATPAQTVISNETLMSSTFVVNKQSATAKCGTAGCSARTFMFAPVSVTCPAATGQTCTFHISLDTKTSIQLPPSCQCLGSGATGFFQFSIDGVAPTIGPTDANGHYLFEANGYTANLIGHQAARLSYSASVITAVTNSGSNTHTIVLNVGCSDALKEGGCGVTTHWSTMRVDVFEP
jgi:hypothetical protein